MTAELVPVAGSEVAYLAELTDEDAALLRAVLEDAVSAASKRAYRSHLTGWITWCRSRGYCPMPATDEVVAAYLTHLAERTTPKPCRPSTIKAVKSAIATAHSMAGHPNPTGTRLVQRALQAIDRRHLGGAVKRARPATGDDIIAMASTGTGRLVDLRDAAIILIGFGGCMRRSEIVALNVEDIEQRRDGVVANIRKSKTDQTGKGSVAPLPDEAVEALNVWLDAAGITSGAIFRNVDRYGNLGGRRLTGQAVRLIVQGRAKEAARASRDHEPQWSAHSLRRGAATEADANGASGFAVKRLGRWRSMDSVAMYVDGTERPENLSQMLGLKKDEEHQA